MRMWNKMKVKNNILLIISALLLSVFVVSCEKDNRDGVAAEAVLQLNVSIDGFELQSDTKGYYEGSVFKNGESFGLCIVEHGTETPFHDGYGNIEVIFKSGKWVYKIGSNEYDKLTLTSTGKTADVFAYAPYINDPYLKPTTIPVNISDNLDFMYDKDNVASSHLNINPSSGGNINLPISFYHALSRLCFNIQLENDGSDQLLNYVEIRKKSTGSTSLYSSGTFNAKTNTFSMNSANSLRVNYPVTQLDTAKKAFEMLLYPVTYSDNSYSIVFGIDGFEYEYVIRSSDLAHGSSVSGTPFSRLYLYTFNFTFDNYVHLNGITIKNGWTTGAAFGYDL